MIKETDPVSRSTPPDRILQNAGWVVFVILYVANAVIHETRRPFFKIEMNVPVPAM